MTVRRSPSPRAGFGAVSAAADIVRRRARFDVSRRIADSTGLRRLVELARDELGRRGQPQIIED